MHSVLPLYGPHTAGGVVVACEEHGGRIASAAMTSTWVMAAMIRSDPHIKIYARQDTMQTVGCILAVLEPWQVEEIDVDLIGIGAGVYDRLAELKRQGVITAAVVGVNVATAAPDQPVRGEPRGRLRRDYLWLEMTRWLREEERGASQFPRRPCLSNHGFWRHVAQGCLVGVKCSCLSTLNPIVTGLTA